MHSLFTFLNSVILLGAVQGFIVSGLLFNFKKGGISNKILAALIFLLALASLKIYLNSQDWFTSSRICSIIEAFVPFFIIMPVGPLIFFYVKSFSDPDFKITKKQWRHFYPVIVDLVPHLTVIIYLVALLTHLAKKHDPVWNDFIDTYYVYSDIPRWLSVSFYLWITDRFLFSYKMQTNIAANERAGNYKWLQLFVRVFMVFQVIWLLYLIPYVIPRYSDRLLNSVDWFPLYLPLTILIYWLGIKGYMMALHHSGTTVKKTGASLSTLSPANIEHAILLLKKAMEVQQLYLDPLLNLTALSTHTGLPQKTISFVLNQHLNKSFNEFINRYRVEALKEKMQQPGMNNLTIAGVAFECGFNSQATFQRTFKEITGMSPTEYKKNALSM